MKRLTNPYERLEGHFTRQAIIEEAVGMLGWDAAVMMPPGGAAARADQMAVLAGLAHDILSAPQLAEDLEEAESCAGELGQWDQANLRLMRHAQRRACALPRDLVEAQARANSACEKIWREARQNADFHLVKSALMEVVKLVREAGQALGMALSLSPYDALMDGFQRGVRASDVVPIFTRYEAFLREALPKAEARLASRPRPFRPVGSFPIPMQEQLCRKLSENAGLDYRCARLDRSAHPFSGGVSTDSRITTRYDENDFSQALMAVMHETGHALYEQGLPKTFARQPVGAAAGMAVHESQSLVLEMQVCRSDAYLSWLAPQLAGQFGGDPRAYTAENVARLYRRVGRGFIRVDADELTYPAHIILRFRLEQAMVSGDLAVGDLPGAWNDGFKSLLGLVPPDDRQGCLQDIHWYDGGFGYFPCYTLGAMAAAQLMAAARRSIPDLDKSLAKGDLSTFVTWLRAEIHGRGSLLGFNELMEAITGKPLDPGDFQAYLTQRYLS